MQLPFANTKYQGFLLFLIGGIALPFSIMTLYLLASRSIGGRLSPNLDYVAFGMAVASGTLFIWRLVRRAQWPIAAALVYAFLTAGALFFFSFQFVCAVFYDCV